MGTDEKGGPSWPPASASKWRASYRRRLRFSRRSARRRRRAAAEEREVALAGPAPPHHEVFYFRWVAAG
eukprot:8223309-Heterocapsa_arctica.AAC.1